MRTSLLVFTCALLGLLAGCASRPPPTVPDASKALDVLMADSDEGVLKRDPLRAVYRGDLRYADQHGDYLSDAYIGAERAAAQDDLARLGSIDRAALPAGEKLAFDTFRWQRQTDLQRLSPQFTSFGFRLKPDHFDGWHQFFPDFSSGQGAAPYRTPKDYADGLSRIDGFVVWLDAARVRLGEGATLDVVHPRFVAERMVVQFDTLAGQGADTSPFFGPVRQIPADWPAAQREQITRDYRSALDERLRPACARMRDFLRDDYLPRTRGSVGLSALPGGLDWYRHLVMENTTTALAPDEIHQIGLAEVARIRQSMDAVRIEAGFAGPLPAFLEFMRTDARFQPASAQALKDGYVDIGRRVDLALDRLFAHRPHTALELRPTPANQERTDAAARYQQGTPDGSRPGIFYFNTWDLPSRKTSGMETLYLHEAVPGHHYQVSVAQENLALPKLLRFGGNTAYSEGWALYAESLGFELGLFTDPYQRFGYLDDEMLRAMRLVVDSGLHTKGWTREQAIDYMLAYSSMSRTDAVAEVERYIAIPAQALAYKIGQLTIRRLRMQAEAALGPRFDVRAFHDQVLNTGALPLAVLEAKIEAWIAAGGPRDF